MAKPKREREKRSKAEEPQQSIRRTEVVRIADLKPHPRNYKSHPEDQLKHIAASLRQHGFYRNVVVARDGTILAGHGVVEAATKVLGWAEVPVVHLDLDPEHPLALKVLVSDNETPKFAETDDRALTELLREVASDASIEGLLGTGFDEQMLASLVMVTRPASEIQGVNAAVEWAGAGMPEFDSGEVFIRLIIQFKNEADRALFVEKHGIVVTTRTVAGPKGNGGKTWSAWYPPRGRDDLASVKWVEEKVK